MALRVHEDDGNEVVAVLLHSSLFLDRNGLQVRYYTMSLVLRFKGAVTAGNDQVPGVTAC